MPKMGITAEPEATTATTTRSLCEAHPSPNPDPVQSQTKLRESAVIIRSVATAGVQVRARASVQ